MRRSLPAMAWCLTACFLVVFAGCSEEARYSAKSAGGARGPDSAKSMAKSADTRPQPHLYDVPPPAAAPTLEQAPAVPPAGALPKPAPQALDAESYDNVVDNGFVHAAANPLSTFSIDVDTASFANVRRFLTTGQLPPRGAVRIEELVNYFSYNDPPPKGDAPFSVNLEIAQCPWQRAHKLVRIGLKAREIDHESRPVSNLVFLIDVSGSMNEPDKLPLVKSGLRLLVDQLGENDRVAIVVYAGASGLVLPSTVGAQKDEIIKALEKLSAGGSTNGGEGIRLAYDTAVANFVGGGVNRVILCTDGDFNVGITNRSQLTELIQQRAKSGVFLSVLGFGTGNLKDATMEQLADKGNGNYAYIDSLSEARKVFVEQMTGTLITIAKDVKIQVDFNAAKVAAYRLVGYENRLLKAEDFKDDAKDAGEIGAGHSVTAFYEIVPAGVKSPLVAEVDPSKYQKAQATKAAGGDELLTVRLRYKDPDGTQSKPLEAPLKDSSQKFDGASEDFRFAAMVAAFGMLLRESPYKGDADFDTVLEIAASSVGKDPRGYRKDFVEIARMARSLKGGKPTGGVGP
jgi:Ca-activated chloride channel family protein